MDARRSVVAAVVTGGDVSSMGEPPVRGTPGGRDASRVARVAGCCPLGYDSLFRSLGPGADDVDVEESGAEVMVLARRPLCEAPARLRGLSAGAPYGSEYELSPLRGPRFSTIPRMGSCTISSLRSAWARWGRRTLPLPTTIRVPDTR